MKKLRKATIEDAKNLFEWRNDPLTREQSIHTDPVEWQDHLAWLERSFSNPSREIYIFEEDGKPVGTCRIDKEKKDGQDIYELSWTVSPVSRGQGVAKRMVGSLVEDFNLKGKTLLAKIKVKNIPSLKIATSLGFVKVFDDQDISE